VPRRSQVERTRTTQDALIRTARRLFAERGYAHVPADEIAAEAGLTRGALYHHYADKQALFRVVFEALEGEITDEIRAAADEHSVGWVSVTAALTTFLDVCQRPEVVQIALTDAPAVLGWQTWREIEAMHGLGLITEHLQALSAAGLLVRAPVPMLAQLTVSAVIEAALLIANADDRDAARAEVGEALLAMFAGLVRGAPGRPAQA
jgi:AcrR family transcriptional regulator